MFTSQTKAQYVNAMEATVRKCNSMRMVHCTRRPIGLSGSMALHISMARRILVHWPGWRDWNTELLDVAVLTIEVHASKMILKEIHSATGSQWLLTVTRVAWFRMDWSWHKWRPARIDLHASQVPQTPNGFICLNNVKQPQIKDILL